MKILAVDTSSAVATAAICEDEKLICETTLNNKLTHSQTLMPIISEIFEKSELTPKDIDLFAVAEGPGSFTGLRIGITTIKALAHACNKDVVGVNTLEALCYNLPFSSYLMSPIMDARRGEVYNAFYKNIDGLVTEVCPSRAIPLEDVLSELLKIGEKVVFLGDAVPVYKEIIIERLGDLALFAPQNANAQRASSVCEAAKGKLSKSYYELVPNYYRKSQAERELEERRGK